MIHEEPPSCQVGQVKMLLNGASGRMGQRIEEVVRRSSDGVIIVARRNQGDRDVPMPSIDVVVDFSRDEGARDAAELALKVRSALLIGTTGISEATLEVIRRASTTIPVLVAPNTSLGVAVMRALVVEAAALLGEVCTVAISETHHTKKVDRPSGTALLLADAVERGSSHRMEQDSIESRREGDVIGDHTVTFTLTHEELTLSHHAVDRELFAEGAVRLARWISRQKPGFYGLDDWFADHRRRTR